MTLILLLASAALFVALLHYLHVIEISTGVFRKSRQAMAVMSDATLDDDQKESAVQAMTVEMFATFGKIIVRLVLAAVPPTLLVWAAIHLELTSMDLVVDQSMSWLFIAANIALFSVAIIFRKPA